MSFFIKAAIKSLKLYPIINAEVENNEIVYKNYYNISFAVGTDKGLVVPVLKNADEMSFAEIEKNIKKLSDKANGEFYPSKICKEVLSQLVMVAYMALCYQHL